MHRWRYPSLSIHGMSRYHSFQVIILMHYGCHLHLVRVTDTTSTFVNRSFAPSTRMLYTFSFLFRFLFPLENTWTIDTNYLQVIIPGLLVHVCCTYSAWLYLSIVWTRRILDWVGLSIKIKFIKYSNCNRTEQNKGSILWLETFCFLCQLWWAIEH